MAKWASYKVDEPVRKPHIRDVDGKRFKWWITVHFFDDKGNEYEKRTYHYTTPEEVLADIHAGKEINLNHCYVKGLSLGWRLNDEPIPVILHDAKEALFDGGLDFSGVDFNDGDISFFNSNFSGAVNFSYADFGKGDLWFQFASTDSYMAFYGAHFGNEYICFQYVDFGIGQTIFDCAKFGSGIFICQPMNSNSIMSFHQIECLSSNFYIRSSKNTQIGFHKVIWNTPTELKIENVRSVRFSDCYFNIPVTSLKIAHGFIEFDNCINNSVITVQWINCCFIDTFRFIQKVRRTYFWDKDVQFSIIGKHHRASETALLLKENFRKMGRYNDEDEAYFIYKKHQLRGRFWESIEGKWYKKFKLLWHGLGFLFQYIFFELLSGYGVRIGRAIVSTAVTIVGFALFYYLRITQCGDSFAGSSAEGVAGKVEQLSPAWQAGYHSAITFLTIGYGDMFPASKLLRVASGLEGYMGLFLMAVFTVTFMRKILR